ncbi:MAG: peptidylprolyl isomerase [Flavobacteriales bacterium]
MDKVGVTVRICAAFAVIFMACGGQEPQHKQPEAQIETEVSTVDEAAIREAARQIASFPTLTDDMAPEFLLDWWNQHKEQRTLKISTSYGDITLELFDDTPLHSGNLHYKTSRGYYRPSEFVRVVPNFVVQGGNSEDPLAQERRWLIGKHTLPSEFTSTHFHHRGAVAMGRTYEGNPDKRSAAYDFYIVVGRKVMPQELHNLEKEKKFTYPDWAKSAYLEEGGAPHLDFEHTVFGRVVSGMDVVDALSRVQTDASDWPLHRLDFEMATIETPAR